MVFVQYALIFAVVECLLLVRGQTTHTVMVGLQGSFFDPPTLSAGLNDTVTFVFAGFVHTVTQSSLANPCLQIPGGFSSGPAGKLTNGSQPAQTWDLHITNVSQPIWFFCEVTQPTSHCGSGMVGVINPPSIEVYQAWRASAEMVSGTPVPNFDAVLTGVGAFATQTPSIPSTSVSIPSTLTSSSPSTAPSTSDASASATPSAVPASSQGSATSHLGAIVGGAVGGAVVIALIIGAIIWFCRQQGSRSVPLSPATDDSNFFRYNPVPIRRPSEAFVEAKQLENASSGNLSHGTPPRALSPDNSFSPNRRGPTSYAPPGIPRIVEPHSVARSGLERQTSFGSTTMSHGPASPSVDASNINMHALANEVAVLLRAPSSNTLGQANPIQNPEGPRQQKKYLNGQDSLERTASPLGPPAYRTAMVTPD